jgi:hypothetical protein
MTPEAGELEKREPKCLTHFTGCACHEAKRDAEIEALKLEAERLRGLEIAARPLLQAQTHSEFEATISGIRKALNERSVIPSVPCETAEPARF